MKNRRLGANGPQIPAIGLGCMGMSQSYGMTNDAESIATIRRALDLGVTHLDTSDYYGEGSNELLVSEGIKGRRQEAFVATKFGLVYDSERKVRVNGRPEYVRAACDASLQRLGTDVIDLYYLHRVDPDVPIEETVGAMARLVDAGKVRLLGLSEASPATLERAQAYIRLLPFRANTRFGREMSRQRFCPRAAVSESALWLSARSGAGF